MFTFFSDVYIPFFYELEIIYSNWAISRTLYQNHYVNISNDQVIYGIKRPDCMIL